MYKDIYKKYFYQFRDLVLDNFFIINKEKYPNIKVEALFSISADLVNYKEFSELLPIYSFALTHTYRNINILAISTLEMNEVLSAQERSDLFGCIKDTVYLTWQSYSDFPEELFNCSLDSIPFEKDYYFDSDNVLVMFFKIEMDKHRSIHFFLVISLDDFLTLNRDNFHHNAS